VLTNPDLLSQVRKLITPVVIKNQPKAVIGGKKLQATIKESFGRLWSGIKDRVQTAKQACGQVLSRISQWTCKLVSRLKVLGQFKRPLLLSCGVGLVAGVGAYFAGPYVAALAGWLSGFATMISVQTALAWERLKAASRPDS
jgi:hypothetical protein